MPRPKISSPGAFKLYQVQTFTGVPANSTADFVLSAKGAQPEWMYMVVNRALPASFITGKAWCSSLNAISFRVANVTGTSAQIGSCAFDVIGI